MKNTSPQPPSPRLRGSSLTRIVPWSQQLVCEVLHPGDLAIDLTAGKGRDTLALAQAVGPQGQVVAVDLQDVALEQTAELLQRHGFEVNLWPAQAIPQQSGIFLVRTCHSTLPQLLSSPVKAIIANLGYLPGGELSLVTQPASTLAALEQSLALLVPGGRLAVTVYPAHPGGDEEAAAVNAFFSGLPAEKWQVLSLQVVSCSVSPYLLVAERIS